ncbi:AMP-binding protein [Achromobacter piechaudii]|uniref:AMP-binding enzyme n=1 Tax=Achromobacter piechaudii ATCC 43553 TaxID=742159 RepID=D4XB60_9BURK|nr:AMP-binding protein [Achromobacter piechaudii]EFF76007.1 AMP-binding enzyme [Achromobacter piechaudii ATCC 43553]
MRWIPLEHLLLPDADANDVLLADDPPLTRADFAHASLRVAGALWTRSARRVALWFDDAASLAIALLACWRADVVAILPGDAQPGTCASLDADIDAWLTDADLPVPSARQWRLDALQDHAPLAPIALDPSHTLVLCTSGSSGTPKPLHKQWRQLSAEVHALQRQWPAPDAPVLGSVSAQHMYGLPFRVLWPLCAGRLIDRRQRHYPEELQQASLRYPTFTWVTSPAMLRRLGQRLDWAQLRGRLLRIHSSGGALPSQVSDDIERELGLRPTEIYGSSETGAVAWRTGDSDWQALPGVAINVNPDGALRVQSPWVNAADEQTSDGARLTANGFELLGRLDRIVKIEEKRVSLPMLEQALMRHAYVADARLGSTAGAPRLTALIALSATGLHVLRNQGRKTLVEALRAHLADGFESLAIARSWRFFRHLPSNAQGKLPQALFDVAAGPRPTEPQAVELPGQPANERRYTLDIPYDMVYFSGHFPSVPVVPGVAQISWAMSLARQDLCPALHFGGMEALKFQRLLRPGDQAEMALRWDEAKQKLYFTCTVQGAPCSSGRIIHQARHAAT